MSMRALALCLAIVSGLGAPAGGGAPPPGVQDGIRGRVVGPGGLPVAACRVSIGEHSTLTDEDGRFRLPSGEIPTSPLVLRLEAPGFASHFERLTDGSVIGPFDLGTFSLSSGISVAGSVLDTAGTPIPGADVFLTTALGHLETRSDDAGRFRFERVDPARYDLLIHADGFALEGRPGIAVVGTRPELELGRLSLESGVELSGRVVDPDGRPVAGATVRVNYDSSAPSFANRVRGRLDRGAGTDTSGRFRLTGLRPGSDLTLGLNAEGHIFYRGGRLRLSPDADRTVVEALTARPVGSLVGRIVTPSGEPIAGAYLAARMRGEVAYTAQAQNRDFDVTDADGRFRLDRLLVEEHLLYVSALGYAAREGIPASISAGASTAMTIVLQAVPSGRLAVRVEPPHGSTPPGRPQVGIQGVSPATVEIADREPLDAAGSFTWPRLPAGRYTLEVLDPLGGRLHSQQIEVAEGSNEVRVVLPDPGPRAALSGRLIGPRDEPVRFAYVGFDRSGDWYGASAHSDGSGAWRIDLPPGSYRVTIDHPDFAYFHLASLELEAGSRVLEPWRLERGLAIGGRIEGLARHELSRMVVSAFNEEAGVSGSVDASGRFEVDHLAPGVWTVQAELVNSPRQATARIVVHPDTPVTDLVVRFPPASELAGRVTDHGLPLVGAGIWAGPLDHTSTHGGGATTDPDGRFSLRGLPAGLYYLGISVEGVGRVHKRGIELPTDTFLEIALDTGRVAGRVVRAGDRSPMSAVFARFVAVEVSVPGAFEVMVQKSHERFSGVQTDSEGRFDVAPLEPGRWRIEIHADGFTPARVELTVAPGAVVDDLEIEMVPTEGLHLTIATETGPIPYSVRAALKDESGRIVAETHVTPEESRETHWRDAPPGNWSLTVRSEELGSRVTIPVAIPGPTVHAVLPSVGKLHVAVAELEEETTGAELILIDADGKAVHAYDRSAKRVSVWPISTNRRFYVWNLEPGVYQVRVEAEDGRSWSRWVAVDADQFTEVDF